MTPFVFVVMVCNEQLRTLNDPENKVSDFFTVDVLQWLEAAMRAAAGVWWGGGGGEGEIYSTHSPG